MNNEQNQSEKAELRRKMRVLRRNLPIEMQKAASEGVARRLFMMAKYQNARTVMGYMAVRGELDVSQILEDVLSQGKRLCLPRCGENGEMTARLVGSFGELSRGMLDIPEPAQDAPVVPPEEIDLIITPGVAFDAQCRRLGQGGGYYDRFLPETRAVTVGVCHAFALIGSLPTEAHDRRMDAVVTPEQIIERKREHEE